MAPATSLPDPSTHPADKIRIMEETPDCAVGEDGGRVVRNAYRWRYYERVEMADPNGRRWAEWREYAG